MDERFLHDTGVELTKLSKITIANYKKFSKLAVKDDTISVCGQEILNSLRYYPEKNTVSDLSETVEVSKGLISREVEALRKKGYIKTATDDNDRRVLRIFIAHGAEQVIRSQKEMLFKLIYQMAGDMSDEQLIKFRELIGIVTANAITADPTKPLGKDIDFDEYTRY